jgi:predicted O-methyltransferase YrrM
MNIDHFAYIKSAIEESTNTGLLADVAGLEGLSGKKLVGILQRCAQYQDRHNYGVYLEVGVFKGLSLISVASVLQDSSAFGIDNFSQFDPDGKNQKIVASLAEQKQLENLHLINLDYEDALENLQDHLGDHKVATYFIDGPHDYRSQFTCLNLVKPFLTENAVIIIDDCNYEHVRLANRDFLVANPEYKLFFEAYTESHPKNMTDAGLQTARTGWWNGVNVIVKDVDDKLQKQFPPTRRSRRLYENEHWTQAHQYGALGPDALSILTLLDPLKPRDIIHALRNLRQKMKSLDTDFIGNFPYMNTFSDKLAGCQFNKSLKDYQE